MAAPWIGSRPYSRCQSLKPSLVFLNRASYGRWRNNAVTSQEREVTMMLRHNLRTDHWAQKYWSGDVDLTDTGWLKAAKRRHYVAGFIVTSFSWWTFICWKNNNTCLMGDAILRIPRDARVRAYRTRDTYDGVVPATSKRQPYCHSSYIELSGTDAQICGKSASQASLFVRHCRGVNSVYCRGEWWEMDSGEKRTTPFFLKSYGWNVSVIQPVLTLYCQ